MADKKTIWVVDDDPAIRELVTFMVTEAGYEVDAFASGAEVLASGGGPPDAVLLDLMMPEVDGVEVLKEISRLHPKLPVIMVTADNDVQRAVEVTKLGAYDYINKPFRTEELLLTLKRARPSSSAPTTTPPAICPAGTAGSAMRCAPSGSTRSRCLSCPGCWRW